MNEKIDFQWVLKETQLVDISKVKKNPRNPRIKNDDKFQKLKDSIQNDPEMMWLRPIVVNSDFVVLGWNMRLQACKELGIDKIPIIVAEDLSEQKQRDFLIKDNVAYGDWDIEMLKEDFDLNELHDLWLDVDWEEDENVDPTEGEDDVDIHEFDEVEPIVLEGDIFKLGSHTLMCGDSMNEKHIQKLLEAKGEWLTHCISDPPYGIAYNPDKHGMIKNDDKFLDYTQLAQKYTDWFFCMWTGYQVLDEWLKITKNTFEKITNLIIWHKGGGWMWDCKRTLAQDFEPLIVVNRGNEIQGYRGSATWMWQQEEKEEWIKKANKEDLKALLYKITQGTTIWKVGKDSNISYMHPTQKPVEINERVLSNFTQAWDNVLDLFWGSWSNLIACEKMNRNCFMMELDPKYAQVILKRFYEFTGEEPICLNRDLDIYEIVGED